MWTPVTNSVGECSHGWRENCYIFVTKLVGQWHMRIQIKGVVHLCFFERFVTKFFTNSVKCTLCFWVSPHWAIFFFWNFDIWYSQEIFFFVWSSENSFKNTKLKIRLRGDTESTFDGYIFKFSQNRIEIQLMRREMMNVGEN